MTENESTSANGIPDINEHVMQNGHVNPLRILCAQLHEQIEAFLQEDIQEERLKAVQAQCRHSLDIIQEALDRYPLHGLSLSYNGGKDCLVLLLLYLSLLSQHPHLPDSLPSIYIPHTHPFPTVDAFVDFSSARYRLSLTRQAPPSTGNKSSMREAFATYLSSPPGQPIRAIFVGTRRTDPHGEHLSAFDPTDRGWPPFMRVHPVLEWRYAEVWAFLRYLGVGYCRLYDEGYTSLGGVGDTHPNPRLRYLDDQGKERWRPAYELEEDAEERLGRD